MTTPLKPERIAELVAPYLQDGLVPIPAQLYAQLALYLDLLFRWNARTNLTAVREPERVVERHFGESLFAGIQLAGLLPSGACLLDFGSGAGFPGLPVQLLIPEMRVTLAESQGKKAAFLREAVRLLGLSTEVWNRRVELMPEARQFDCVILRAVDRMGVARAAARKRVAGGGWLATLDGVARTAVGDFAIKIPDNSDSFLNLARCG